MLKDHMDAVENVLVALTQIQANAGHPIHKGTPRELFIREFLGEHLPSSVDIGTGEIIDSNSTPGGARNQFDIVLYKKNYSKLHFGGGIFGFLVESVIATIEVKSTLDEKGVEQSVKAAHYVKSLSPSINNAMQIGWVPPKPLSFIVAYDGPASMATANQWINNAHRKHTIPFPVWNQENRTNTAGTALDGLFVLRRGCIKLDNTPLTLVNPEIKNQQPFTSLLIDSPSNNLLMFFLILQEACNNLNATWLNPNPYLLNIKFDQVSYQ